MQMKIWPVHLSSIKISDAFWSQRQLLMSTSLQHQYENLERFHHIDNFRIVAGVKQSAFVGLFFYDSDVYKWLEASIYSLHVKENDALRQKVEDVVHLVTNAQCEDGYINTYFTLNFPEERMKNFYNMHELYCGGHLIEAAVARYIFEEKDDLLGVAKKLVDFLIAFDPKGKNPTFMPGHQEIELALVKLYRYTNVTKYLDLAIQLLEKRGRDPHVTRTAFKNSISTARLLTRQSKNLARWEAAHGKIETPAIKTTLDAVSITFSDLLRYVASYLNGKYEHQHMPVRDQREPVGHAVRAMYMYSAMTDVYNETRDASLLEALQAIWTSMTEKRMYVTGGVGSLPLIEGFGKDYELDNKKAYCETCAAIGNFLWNWRMSQVTGEPKHADLMERVLYNAILSGWSLDGIKYRYSNPLETKKGKMHQEWFKVACCPSNIGRIVSSLGQYVAMTNGESTIWINQYIGCEIGLAMEDGAPVFLKMTSDFPWNTRATITINNDPPAGFTLDIRVPMWAHEVKIVINGEEVVKKGDWGVYIPVTRDWVAGDVVDIVFDNPPIFVLPDPHVKANHGRVAIQRGPIIYAIEAADNSWYKINNLAIDITDRLHAVHEPELLGGITTVSGTGIAWGKPVTFKAIPFYTYGNRGPYPMAVWNKVKD